MKKKIVKKPTLVKCLLNTALEAYCFFVMIVISYCLIKQLAEVKTPAVIVFFLILTCCVLPAKHFFSSGINTFFEYKEYKNKKK